MSTPDNELEALFDTQGWYVSFFGHAPVVRMYLSPPLSDGDKPESFITLGVQGLTTLSQLAAEWARWLAEQTGEPIPEAPPVADRERRIRELAREWASQKIHYAPEAKKLIGLAAEIIDALDAAEVPPKGGE